MTLGMAVGVVGTMALLLGLLLLELLAGTGAAAGMLSVLLTVFGKTTSRTYGVLVKEGILWLVEEVVFS